MNTAIRTILDGNNLSYDQAKQVMIGIMEGKTNDTQISAFLTAMRMKGETVEEITACAEIMRQKASRLTPDQPVLDIVGTGGDELFTFNISTVSSFVVAACGVATAKHGGRSVSSKCGSADLLEALGANIELTPQQSKIVLEKTNMCFLWSQMYHSAMKHVAPVRKALGVRTLFNILGPLANPAGANMQLLGVYSEELVPQLAQVLANLGVERAMVVHGRDGLDEISLTDTTTICEVNYGKISNYLISPEQMGLKSCEIKDLVGGSPEENAQIARNILQGEQGPKTDIVLLNSAFCIYLSQNQITLKECIERARDALQSGKAYKKMQSFINATHEV